MVSHLPEFQKEHQLILDAIRWVKENGISKPDSRQRLLSIKDTLIKHLKNEDLHLYPVLKNAAENDAIVKETLELFTRDMDNVVKLVEDFFAKIDSGASGIDIARFYGLVAATLTGRISREENILYQEYQNALK